MVDQSVVACAGEWCKTTCERWVADVLHVGNSLISCDAFVAGLAYPRGAEPCGEGCLPPEVGVERYPMPTGFGFLCAPGTCEPAVQSRYASGGSAHGLGVLRCPCNWFGADCTDDTRAVLAVKKRVSLGRYVLFTLLVGDEDWWQIMQGHRPGAVVRLQAAANESCAGDDGILQPASTASWAGPRPLEQPLALATLIISAPGVSDGALPPVGEIDVLTGPPDAGMSPVTTELLRRLRALPIGWLPHSGPGALSINPVVGGFFARDGGLFMDALGRASRAGNGAASEDAALHPSLERFRAGVAGEGDGCTDRASDVVTDVVLVATGTGLAAMRPTIELLIRRNRQMAAVRTVGGGERSAGHGERCGLEEGRRIEEYDSADLENTECSAVGTPSTGGESEGVSHGDVAGGDGPAVTPRVRIHLYYGLRLWSELPWGDELASWVEKGELQLTILISQQEQPDSADGEQEGSAATEEQGPNGQRSISPVLRAAAQRGKALARTAADLRRPAMVVASDEAATGDGAVAGDENSALGTASGSGPISSTWLSRVLLETGEGKLYVHQALAVDLSFGSLLTSAPVKPGALDSETDLSLWGRGARLDTMLVAVCGRSDILGGTERALLAACLAQRASEGGLCGARAEVGSREGGDEGDRAAGVDQDGAGKDVESECKGLVAQRLFLNI
jgi:hypothetical protein